MANPTIKVGSASGGVAEPNASGAGPTTAVKGTNNATSNGATPSVITLGGSPDLSGVASDGSHAIYLQTAAGRRFSKITAVNNSAKTVTIEDTITGANCTNKSWAIGGVLASLFGTGYSLLLNDGTSSGDAKGGWIVELQSGHAETASVTIFRVGGSLTAGPLKIQTASGAASRPVLTTSSASGLTVSGIATILKGFDVKATASGASYVVRLNGEGCEANAIRAYSTGATKAAVGIGITSRSLANSCEVYDCQTGISPQVGEANNCYVHDCNTGSGIGIDFGTVGGMARGNVIVDCTTGISSSGTTLTSCVGNVVDTCTTGIIVGSTTAGASVWCGTNINNVVLNCTTGLHFSNASATEAWATAAFYFNYKFNAFYNNTNHLKYNATTSNDVTPWDGFVVLTADPFTTASKATRKTAGDWSGGTDLKSAGFPQSVVGLMAVTRSYVDLGIQRQEASSTTVILIED